MVRGFNGGQGQGGRAFLFRLLFFCGPVETFGTGHSYYTHEGCYVLTGPVLEANGNIY